MILAISTSSPWTSVALLDANGRVLAEDRALIPMHASQACMELMESICPDLRSIEVYAADIGPGSFSGVRVGVTIAKTLAFANGKQVAGATSFDLVDPFGDVAIPSKRSEYFIRRAGREPERTSERPSGSLLGYGPWFDGGEAFPHAGGFAQLEGSLVLMRPEELLPAYLIEPSISQPKKPYAGGARG